VNLSKSKLLALRQCPKRLWLELHKPHLREHSTSHGLGQVQLAALQADFYRSKRHPRGPDLPALFEATVGNAEALLLAMYGDSFRVLDEDDKSTAMNNVIDNIKRREREMKRFLSSQEALSSVTKEYGTDISRLTLPF
jgi:hypothetical protein